MVIVRVYDENKGLIYETLCDKIFVQFPYVFVDGHGNIVHTTYCVVSFGKEYDEYSGFWNVVVLLNVDELKALAGMLTELFAEKSDKG